MNLQHLVYDDGVIAVGLMTSAPGDDLLNLALRWLPPRPYTDATGRRVETTNSMGGATEWFIVPATFASAIGRTLVEQKTAGLEFFLEDGFAALVQWLIDDEELHDSMGY